jgi:DNA-binding transcriptional MerR regulator
MNRYSIAEAAKALGVTQQAIHGRISRGTIRHERAEDGKQYVFLTDEELSVKRDENTLHNGFINDYIESLKSEIETLKSHTESLINDREEWKEEARRKDTIIAQMNQTMAALIHRIPELEASPDVTESTERPSSEESRGDVLPDTQNASQRPSWWRRIFAT